MHPTQQLHQLGQRLWLDNITRTLLADGTLARYIRDLAVSGLTSNPAIFEQAIKGSDAYDAAIRARAGHTAEAVFFDLALEDLTLAADLFHPLHAASAGNDGWVSLEVSPLLAHDAAATVQSAIDLHARAARPNLFIKIPGSAAGCTAIEEAIFAGVPVNVTLLFSDGHYSAAADAYVRALERRHAAGLSLNIESVASMFVSRWDAAGNEVTGKADAATAAALRNQLGIAVATRTWHAHQALLASARWQKLAAAGARPQRVLWASTGTKDAAMSPSYYVDALALPGTINTLPEKTLLAFAEGGQSTLAALRTRADNQVLMAEFARAGVDAEAMAVSLQQAGIEAFAKSWDALLACVESKA